jgi:hypothetical protein
MNMQWIGYGYRSHAIRRIRAYLPVPLQNLLDNKMHSSTLTKSQLKSIVALGKNIGLDRNEVYAAVPSNMDPSGFVVNRRMTLFSALLTLVIIVVASFLFLVITGNYPLNDPNATYAPGSRYGSISPNDFKNRTDFSIPRVY